MEFDLSAFKVLIKKIFPPSKCVYTIDTTNDGESDSILIRALNVVFPIEIPEEIDIEDLSKGQIDRDELNFSEFLSIYLDDEQIHIPKNIQDKEAVTQNFTLYHNDQKFSFKDIMQGSFGGTTIALGDKIDIVIKVSDKTLDKLTNGTHKLKLELTSFPTLEVEFNLSEENFNRKYLEGTLE